METGDGSGGRIGAVSAVEIDGWLDLSTKGVRLCVDTGIAIAVINASGVTGAQLLVEVAALKPGSI